MTGVFGRDDGQPFAHELVAIYELQHFIGIYNRYEEKEPDALISAGDCATDGLLSDRCDQISSEKRIARPTSTIFARGKDVIKDPSFPFETVCK